MKPELYTTKKNLIVVFVLSIIILLSGCKKESLEPDYTNSTEKTTPTADQSNNNVSPCVPACQKTVTLLAGQHIDVGTILLKNNTTNGTVDVTFTTTGNWRMTFIALYIGNCNLIPVNPSGNTMPGQYPYKQTFSGNGVTTITIQLPAQTIPTCGCVAAHAQVFNTQTNAAESAWGEGTTFTNTAWAMYFPYCLASCAPDPQGCAYSKAHWFVDPTTVWPSRVQIGSYTYTQSEAMAIWNEPNTNGIPDSKFVFQEVISIRLSGNSVAETASINGDMIICETYLNSLGKLASNYLPTGNQTARDAADRIRGWIKKNECGVTALPE